MPVEITMPQLSDTMTEGTVVKWLKKEGEKVKAGEVIAEVETDKATMEMEAFEGGTLAHIAAAEGAKVAVGATMAVLATGKEDPAALKKEHSAGAAKSEAKQSVPTQDAKSEKEPAAQPLAPSRSEDQSKPEVKESAKPQSAESTKPERVAVGSGTSSSGGTFEHASNSEMHEPDENDSHGATRQDIDTTPKQLRSNGNGRTKASPLARRIATDKGIDLGDVKGSGPNGRIVQKDVEKFTPLARSASAARGTEPAPQRLARGSKEVITLTKMRTVIAQRLQQSKQQLPHFYETIDIDVESLTSLREKLNKQLEKEKIRVSLSDFINKAIASSLLHHPGLNAHFSGQKNEITRFGDVNLGIAVALPEGLIVPVLRNIDQMGIKEIRQRSVELVEKARAGKLKQDEMSGATFTVSTLGMYGVREFAAIINPPEVGILAVGAAEARAVVRGGQVVARTMMTVTLSVDHRAVDGASAAEFLRTFKTMLEEPAMMFI